MASDWHRVGAGLVVRFVKRDDNLASEWRTRPPTKREWRRVLDRYRLARDKFIAAVGAKTGLTIAVMEVLP